MSYQHGVQVWEVATGTRRWAGRGQPTRIRRVAWSPDGAHLASCRDDGSVCLWETSDGRLRARLEGHRGMVMCVAWSPSKLGVKSRTQAILLARDLRLLPDAHIAP